MDQWAKEVVLGVLTIIEQDARNGYDTALAMLRAERNEYTVGQHLYWKHGLSFMKWAKSRVHQMSREKSGRGKLAKPRG